MDKPISPIREQKDFPLTTQTKWRKNSLKVRMTQVHPQGHTNPEEK